MSGQRISVAMAVAFLVWAWWEHRRTTCKCGHVSPTRAANREHERKAHRS